MANNCYVDFIIETETEQEADKLDSALAKNYFSAKKEKKGMFIGTTARYLFEPTLERQSEKEIRIMGWVKWSINYKEATDIVRWLRENANITYIGIRYEEMGFNLYGEFVYDNESSTLVDNYVDENDFPEYENNENFYEELEDVFKHNAITVPVYNY